MRARAGNFTFLCLHTALFVFLLLHHTLHFSHTHTCLTCPCLPHTHTHPHTHTTVLAPYLTQFLLLDGWLVAVTCTQFACLPFYLVPRCLVLPYTHTLQLHTHTHYLLHTPLCLYPFDFCCLTVTCLFCLPHTHNTLFTLFVFTGCYLPYLPAHPYLPVAHFYCPFYLFTGWLVTYHTHLHTHLQLPWLIVIAFVYLFTFAVTVHCGWVRLLPPFAHFAS